VEGNLFPFLTNEFSNSDGILESIQLCLTFSLSLISEFLWWTNLVEPIIGIKNVFTLPLNSETDFGINSKFQYHN
jgi:hypothetical protein